ncbi:MAG: hypothetical protein RIB58_09770 [Phycisphaerales bacterium]
MEGGVSMDRVPRSKRGCLARLLMVAAVLILVALLLIALAGPAALSAVAPAALARLGLPGRIEARDISLSWLGELSVGNASLYDPQDQHIASVSVSTSGGLLGLLDGTLEQDLVVQGWAHVEIDEEGTTNVQRALGLQPSSQEASPRANEGDRREFSLPLARVVLDGLDVAVTRAGAPTLAISNFQGDLRAQGSRLAFTATTHLAMPSDTPRQRAQISGAPQHGAIEIDGQMDLADLSGHARATIDSLTSEAAGVLAAFTGNAAAQEAAEVAAQEGLTLVAESDLANGMPERLELRLQSGTIDADIALATNAGSLQLQRRGHAEILLQPFLEREAIRALLLPTQGVSVPEVGKARLVLESLDIPAQRSTDQFAKAAAQIAVNLDRSWITVPDATGQPTDIRVNAANLALVLDGAGRGRVQGDVAAGLRGQPDGRIGLTGQFSVQQGLETLQAGFAAEPGALASLVPEAELTIEQLPTAVARPWLEALERQGLNVQRVVGPKLDASLRWKATAAQDATLGLRVDAQHLQAGAQAVWRANTLELQSPATINIARPGAIALPWLPEGWVVENGRGVSVEVSSARVGLEGLRPRPNTLEAIGTVAMSGTKLHSPDIPTLGMDDLVLAFRGAPDASSLELASTPTVNGQRTSLAASLQTAGTAELLAGGSIPVVTGNMNLSAPTQALRALEATFAGHALHEWVADAAGPQLDLELRLVEPGPDQLLAGQLALGAQHMQASARGIALNRSTLELEGVSISQTPRRPLWDRIAPLAGMQGATLAATAPITIDTGPARFAFGGESALAAALEQTSVQLAVAGDLRIDGVPVGQAAQGAEQRRADVIVRDLGGSLNSLGGLIDGRAGVRGSLLGQLVSPGNGPIGSIEAGVQSQDRGVLRASLGVDVQDSALASGILGLPGRATEAIRGALGNQAEVSITALTKQDRSAPRGWAVSEATLDLRSSRLRTQTPITARFERDSIRLTEPAVLLWTPDENWLGEAIGARVASAQPFQINLDRIELGNPLAGTTDLLDPQVVFIDAGVVGQGAVIAIENRPNIELATMNARVRRVGLSTYALTANAAAVGGGTLQLNGMVEKPTDVQGRLSLSNAVFRGTLKGDDVPVALADAMSNTDGLLGDSLGPMVDLDAEISNGRFVPRQPPSADLRFSVRGPRADASGYGRLADRTIILAEPQTVLTVREVRPEIAQRFSQLIPRLLQVEKRPEDGPAVIRTNGLTIPTDGNWAKGQGTLTVALGTARFQTTSLLGQVLKATGQRAQGQLGRRIDPIELRMVDGVIEYEPFKLPLGDLSLESEGTVNLVTQQMDVIVWVPNAALSDEAAGRFNTGLGSALGRTIPGFESITTVPWRVSGPLASPSIAPAPKVLLERRGDELLGPLLRPGQTLQDLLGLPGGKRDGGG